VKMYRLLLILGPVGVVYGQVEISGSYENILNVQHIKDWAILDLNNLLFSLEGDLGGASFLHADAEAFLPFGSVKANLLDFVPDSLAELISDSLRYLYDYKLEPSFRISNAYLSISWKRLVVRLGKQPLAWGAGYVWNPTEIVTPKLAYDPSYRRDGENALKLAASWGSGGGAEVIGMLRGVTGTPDSIMAAARLNENILGFDISAIGGWLWDTTITPGITQRRILAGGQFAGEIWNIGLWAEGGYNIYKEDSLSYAEFVVGADHTFTFRTHVMAEYLYYGRGFDAEADYTFAGWLEHASGLHKAMGRHLVCLGADQTIISFHNVGISAIFNPVDGSGIVIPRLSLNLADNLDLSAFGLISFGDEDSEFGAAPVKGGILRLTGYF